jgi:nucleoside-diphosphate-sugar epimerase
MVDLYLFALEHRLAGVFNAGFENLTVLDIARSVTAEIPAEIEIKPSNDPRSYAICSDKLLATGFQPKRNVRTAVREMAAAWRDGRLKDEAVCYNVRWMREQRLA